MANAGGRPEVTKVTENAGASFQPDQAVVGLQRSSCAKQSALMGLAIGTAGAGHRYLSTRASAAHAASPSFAAAGGTLRPHRLPRPATWRNYVRSDLMVPLSRGCAAQAWWGGACTPACC